MNDISRRISKDIDKLRYGTETLEQKLLVNPVRKRKSP